MTCGAAPTKAPPKKCRTARGGPSGRSTKLPQSGSHICCAGCGGGRRWRRWQRGRQLLRRATLASIVMRGRPRLGATWRNRGGAQHNDARSIAAAEGRRDLVLSTDDALLARAPNRARPSCRREGRRPCWPGGKAPHPPRAVYRGAASRRRAAHAARPARRRAAGESASLRAVRRLLPVPGRPGAPGRPRVSARGRRACRKARTRSAGPIDGSTAF